MARCPKCNTEVPEQATACKRCGLATARMEGFARERDASVPPALVSAWERAELAWNHPLAHDEVLRLVVDHQAYAWAAARYRTRAGDPVAEAQLVRIRKAAEATLFATGVARKVKDQPRPYRSLTAVMILLVLAAVGGLVYAKMMRDKSEPRGAYEREPMDGVQYYESSPGPTN